MNPDPAHPGVCLSSGDDRYRLYMDESGDHVFNCLEKPSHRFLCVLGCWFRNTDYLKFHLELEELKRCHLRHHPDEPAILHREDIINRRGAFLQLQDPARARDFDNALLSTIQRAEFRVVAIVIDKLALRQKYGDAAAHPYHLAMGFMLQRYCGYLNHANRRGDVMAESRGGKEDRLLADSYSRVYANGVWRTPVATFQRALTSTQLKVKNKAANIAGLQLADLLGHPLRQDILRAHGQVSDPIGAFATRLAPIVGPKLNRHLYSGKVEGYGHVLFPK